MSVQIRPNLSTGNPVLDYELKILGDGHHDRALHARITDAFGQPMRVTALARNSLPLVIIGDHPQALAATLDEHRRDPESGLRPIAVVGLPQDADASVVGQLADVTLPPQPHGAQLLDASHALQALTRRLRTLKPMSDDDGLRLLQFLESRRGGLEPALDPASNIAYRYPLAEAVLHASTEQTVELLTDMARHGVFDRVTVDRVHLCPGPDCSSYRIPVKEICPECHSPDLSMEVSVHHFRCGFMAPESRYADQNGYLTCPKCNDPLRHIGVEYNRPSEVCVCGACGHWAERPELRAWCVDCNRLFAPEEVRTLRIHRYMLTPDARQVARAGHWADTRMDQHPAPDVTPEGSREEVIHRPDDHNREVVRTLLSIQSPSRWPLAVYRVEVDMTDPAAARTPWLEQFEDALSETLNDGEIVSRVNRRMLLILVPESGDHEGPGVHELKRRVRKSIDKVPFTIDRVDAGEALDLLRSGD